MSTFPAGVRLPRRLKKAIAAQLRVPAQPQTWRQRRAARRYFARLSARLLLFGVKP